MDRITRSLFAADPFGIDRIVATVSTAGRAVGARTAIVVCALALALAGCEAGTGAGDAEEAPGAETASEDATVADSGARTDQPLGPTGTASVAGRIAYEGEIPTLPTLRMDADPQCEAKHDEPVRSQALVVGEDRGLANVLVKVTTVPEGRYPPPEEPFVMDQQGCRYHPHVMGVMAGQGLEVLNSDGLLHNVHGLPEVNPAFNRAMPAAVEEATFELPRPEDAFQVKCDVHPWMGAYIAVFEHPFFDVSTEDGTYTIDELPAGTYELEAWHERLGTQTASVTVAGGETATADFTFSR